MLTAIIVILSIQSAISVFLVMQLLIVDELSDLTNLYAESDVHNYVKRGLLALFAFPLFVVCEAANFAVNRRYSEKTAENKCACCLYRLTAESINGSGTKHDEISDRKGNESEDN